MTVIRTPLQQSTLGKTIIRTPVMVQPGAPQQVMTQIIRGQPVSTAVSPPSTTSSTPGQKGLTPGASTPNPAPSTPQPPRPQQGQVKLTMAQLTQLTQGHGGNQGLTVVIQGQGQTTGQLQLIPQGVTVLPGPGQQLMQAAMPNGTVQRFLFTPLATTATAASSTTTTVSTTAAGSGEQKQSKLSPQTQVQQTKPLPPDQSSSVSPAEAQPQTAQSSAQPQPQPQPQSQPQPQPQPQPESPTQPEAHTRPEIQTQTTVHPSSLLKHSQPKHSHPTNPKLQHSVSLKVMSKDSLLFVSRAHHRLEYVHQLHPKCLLDSNPRFRLQPHNRFQFSHIHLQIPSQGQPQSQPQVVMKHNAVIEHLKQKKTLTPTEREENQRMIVCNQVMKYILDKIDKEEKQAAKKRKREESVEQKRSKQNATKLSALLFKHKEQLKAEILKKRALLDKDLQIEVQEELKRDLKMKKRRTWCRPCRPAQ